MSQTSTHTRPTFKAGVDRPLSPHLQIWGWTVTMASSITHRATGIALYAGAFLLTAWLASAALGENAYNAFMGLARSPLGLIVAIGFSWAMMYHLCNGIRHLIWDSGHLLSKEQGAASAWAVYTGSVVLTALIWGIALGVQG